MPRNHNPGTSSLRNRNRVTNKTRLKIHHGTIGDDALVYEEEETLKTSSFMTAGVDAEDANEHHLQAVLSAAAQRNQSGTQRSTRGASEKTSEAPAAYIPIPDSTGVVDNYEEYYSPNRWKDPVSYIRSSETVDEACTDGLANGFTYYMDERDKEWLDKNNEEARGEGTSAQGALSTSGTRTSQRSAKAKGKEPEPSQSITISEDEFELVMGVFEKITHEKTEYLHHGLEQGMAFPPFSDYQDTFSAPLSSATFASYTVPAWIPPPAHLVRAARTIYPHWRERRIERGGHRIIPTLNFDETDTNNESYICFRRREIKAVRKTRASQATSSDKLLRLQAELQSALDLTQTVLAREKLKREVALHSQEVWEKRLALVDMKRKFPGLGSKEDDELLHDKERVPKKLKSDSSTAGRLPNLKLRTRDSELGSPITEVQIRPKERAAVIQSAIERELARVKERDHHWDDQIDNVYQQLPVSFAQRHFKWIPPDGTPTWPTLSSGDDTPPILEPRSVRIRRGRGGRTWIDRRHAALPSVNELAAGQALRQKLREQNSDEDSDMEERDWRMKDRWRFDADDEPAIGPNGAEEQDRVLIDGHEPKFVFEALNDLAHDQDHQGLLTDPTLLVSSADGRQQAVTPFRQLPLVRPPPLQRPSGLPQQTPTSVHVNGIPLTLPSQNGTPISMMKKLQSATGPAQIRISSNNGMRPIAPPTTQPIVSSHTPQQVATVQPPNGVNGGIHQSQAMDVDVKPVIPLNPMLNGTQPSAPESHTVPPSNGGQSQGSSPIRPKSQNQQPAIQIPNGYHMTAMNGFSTVPNSSPYLHHPNANGLSIQQMQNLKSAFAAQGNDINTMHVNGNRALTASYMSHVIPNGANFNIGTNLKLPSARQMQWSSMASPLQRPMSVESSATNGPMSPGPNLAQPIPPTRSPSANGNRSRSGIQPLPMSPHLQHSPSPISSSLLQAQSSPPRAMASPSLQQQSVGNMQGGY